MSSYHLPDCQGTREYLVLYGLWYLQHLSPKGFVDIDDLITEDGLLAARRLLLLVCNLAAKWLVDSATMPLKYV
jgi:hypothetical protein